MKVEQYCAFPNPREADMNGIMEFFSLFQQVTHSMENKSRFFMVKEACRLVPKWKNTIFPSSSPRYNLVASIEKDYSSHTGERMSKKWIELPCSHLL